MTKCRTANRSLPEVRKRVVRMMLQHQGPYETQAGARATIAPEIECVPRTLREWIMQAEKDSGMPDGLTT